MRQSKKPMDVPSPPINPEIKPVEEPPIKAWPQKTPEIMPGKDTERTKAPGEIPVPPK
jgi:hypothetical protein